jgi:hypothetical protein
MTPLYIIAILTAILNIAGSHSELLMWVMILFMAATVLIKLSQLVEDFATSVPGHYNPGFALEKASARSDLQNIFNQKK